MTRHDPFSVARMRGSLYLFAAGKVMSGLIGIAWLLALVRALNVHDYGGYVALIAMLEVVLALSTVGVYAFAQRYVTEARLAHNLGALRRVVGYSVAYRVLTLLVASALLFSFADSLARLIGQPDLAPVLRLYVLVVACEGLARYVELVFESLLEQGRAQACAVARNGLRLVLVVATAWSGAQLSLADVVRIEALCSGLGMLMALVMLYRLVKRVSPINAAPAGMDLSAGRVTSFLLPMYAALCLGMLYNPDTVKLVVSRTLGVAEAAAFGFAHAISNVLLRYLPANLLLGLVRPMLIARRGREGSDEQLMMVANIVLKVNVYLLTPVIVLFAVAGRDVMAMLSGGRFGAQWPVLLAMTALLLLLGLHVVLSLLATVLEDRRAVLLGTLASVPGVGIGIALAPYLGPLAMALGLCASEVFYCSASSWLLRASGVRFAVDWAGWLRIGVAGATAGIAAAAVSAFVPAGPAMHVLLCCVLITPVYIGCSIVAKPLSAREYALVHPLLPSRLRKWLPHGADAATRNPR